MIQGLLVLNNPNYVFHRWHGTLLVIAVTAFCVIFNTYLAKRLPTVESIVLVVHLLGFFAVLIPLWVLAPRGSASDVFTQFLNLGGWPTTGLAFMVGLLSPVYTLIGADSAAHMSEEIRDASLTLPRVILWAAILNGTLGFVMVITFGFTLGSVTDILFTPTGYPFIQVFFNATNSYVGTSFMTAILIVNITSASISTVATASRQTWSFARDKGLPFSSFIAHVSDFLVYRSSSLAYVDNLSITGQVGSKHSNQCRIAHLHYYGPPIFDQYWFYRSFQRHRLSSSLRLTWNLHHISHLPYPTTYSRTTASTASLVPRTIRHLSQHWRHDVSACGLGICIFPRCHSCHTANHELERSHVWRDYDICGFLLSFRGEVGLHSPSGICAEE
jgi:hypothetical protein